MRYLSCLLRWKNEAFDRCSELVMDGSTPVPQEPFPLAPATRQAGSNSDYKVVSLDEWGAKGLYWRPTY